jgi:hypothetical protein
METYTLSQKELQRGVVISSWVKGDLACARAVSLLDLMPRHVKRLKSRLRLGAEAPLAHTGRGRPSHRRLPQRVRDRIVRPARTTYAGFNDHDLCEKLVKKEGFSLGRETLRRLLRSARIGSPRKRRAKLKKLGVPLPRISTASTTSIMNARSATTTLCNGTDALFKSRPSRSISASLAQRRSSMNLSKEMFLEAIAQPSVRRS